MIRSVALAALFALSTLGCGHESQIDRKPVYGNIVGADGRNGMVTFTPIEATIGPAVTGSFEDGAYQFSREDGPVPGRYNVTVELVVPDSSPAATQNGRGAAKRTRKGKVASEGGRLAYEPAKTTTVTVSADGPFEMDLHPTKSSSQ
jgi:hypothetical protein